MIGPEVMLASSIVGTPEQIIASHEGWSFELKFDGIRAVVSRPEVGRIQIFNRRRADITHRYPDVVEQLRDAAFVGLVDGEIVVADPQGRPDFSGAHLRDAQSNARGVRAAMRKAPAAFVPFDVLSNDGFDTRQLPYMKRREHLADMFGPGAISVANPDGATMWKFVLSHDLEGLVAKRPDAAYRAGRQRAWLKIKSTKRISALVCGVVERKGSPGVVGALNLCLWDTDARHLVAIGKVGSGFSAQDLLIIWGLLAEREPVVVDVEYLEVSPSGQLRMPVFRGVRRDVVPGDCTLDSLVVRAKPQGATG